VSRSLIAQRALMRDGCVDGGRGRLHGEVLAHLDVLGKRRRIKAQVREERRSEARRAATVVQTVDADAIPIVVRDQGTFVHYPASIDDLRSLARRLPPDALVGVSGIELRLRPSDPQPRRASTRLAVQPDPYVGRPSVKVLGGAWVPPVLAAYRRDTGRIHLFAYVFDPAWTHASAFGPVMKLAMLSSFVHELAHHDDRLRRVARGRWLMDDRDRAEAYADDTEAAWVARYVRPYVIEQCRDDLRALAVWCTTLEDRPDLVEALQDCPLMNQIGQLLRL
jgi:hypothetical protein